MKILLKWLGFSLKELLLLVVDGKDLLRFQGADTYTIHLALTDVFQFLPKFIVRLF